MNNTKYSWTSRIVDMIGIIASLLLLILLIIKFYIHVTPDRWEVGFEFTGNSGIIMILLVVTIIICASISFIHKLKCKPRS